jgi:protein O-GlcNAc transferase
VRLPHLANYYFRPQPSPSTKTRCDFGLSDEAHVYACLQSLFKFHPDDDAVFAQILRRDPQGVLLLLEGQFPNWTALLRTRFRDSMSDVIGRIQFVPQQPPPDFSRLLAEADVLLDPLHFGGGDTSYQSFAVGTPIVTLPGGFLRSRITYALYRAMGISDCIAASVEDYVEVAVRLGTDRQRRDCVRDKILSANHAIYENDAGVRELENFLIEAVGRQ